MKTWHVSFDASFLPMIVCTCSDMDTVRKPPRCRERVTFDGIEAETRADAIQAAINLFRLDHPESDKPEDIARRSIEAWII